MCSAPLKFPVILITDNYWQQPTIVDNSVADQP